MSMENSLFMHYLLIIVFSIWTIVDLPLPNPVHQLFAELFLPPNSNVKAITPSISWFGKGAFKEIKSKGHFK